MKLFAAARDAVGEEPIAAGGAQKITGLEFREADSERSFRRAGRNSEPNIETKHEDFTAARDAVGEEPIGMGGW